MKIPYITIGYDKYWHQLVFGKAIFELSRHNTGRIYWKRLFGIGGPLRPLPERADTDGLMRFTIYRYDDDRDIICYEHHCGTHKIVDICSRYKCIWKRKKG